MPLTDLPVISLVYTPCPGCWGQKQILERQDDGTYDVYGCGQCKGLGEVANTSHLFPKEPDPS
jgi:hypothetical protein